MNSVSDYQKITVVCDPKNPEKEIMDEIAKRGEIVSRLNCDDGIIFLVKLFENETFESLSHEPLQTPPS